MTKHSELNEKIRQVYDYINKIMLERGYAPSVREICDEFSIKSTASVHYYLNKMEEFGYIKKDKQKSRAVELVHNNGAIIHKDVVNIPLVGHVQAGLPHYAYEEDRESYPFPAKMFTNTDGELFMLEIKGNSMIEAGILEGDKIVVRKQDTARNGEIVVALIGDDHATVKRFFRQNNYITLHPENRTMEDQIYTDDLRILGVVVGLVRTNL